LNERKEMKKVIIASIVVVLLVPLIGFGSPRGNWRSGFKKANKDAEKITSFQEFIKWSGTKRYTAVSEKPIRVSTDLGGGKHYYVDTFEVGYNDGQTHLYEEAVFIYRHNTGNNFKFLSMIKEWMKMQNLDEIIPPAHF
jgi:hypothetical protein